MLYAIVWLTLWRLIGRYFINGLIDCDDYRCQRINIVAIERFSFSIVDLSIAMRNVFQNGIDNWLSIVSIVWLPNNNVRLYLIYDALSVSLWYNCVLHV